jgi:hypothetical protein
MAHSSSQEEAAMDWDIILSVVIAAGLWIRQIGLSVPVVDPAPSLDELQERMFAEKRRHLRLADQMRRRRSLS